jgi:hypothetical protein
MMGVFNEAIERDMEVEHKKRGLVCHSECSYFGIPIYKRSVIYIKKVDE